MKTRTKTQRIYQAGGLGAYGFYERLHRLLYAAVLGGAAPVNVVAWLTLTSLP